MTRSITSLQPLNTFGLEVQAKQILDITSPKELVASWQASKQQNLPYLLIGGGSNVLFLEDFQGIVAVNKIKGIEIKETADEWLLHVGSGENWHQLVEYTLNRAIAGLENLALIPGAVGSSPIQNIGAYGVELKDVCDYVDVIQLDTGTITRLSKEECQFGYRDSIFKNKYKIGYAVIAVGFKLTKHWQPKLTYGPLASLDPATVTPQEIFEQVCAIRRAKLPDPKNFGNAGSFFKNPVISKQLAENILDAYPQAPCYPQADGTVKMAAGWLIDNANLKGTTVGGAAVHQQQALVLINIGQATSQDVIELAALVRNSVGNKFGVWLEPEVRFIGGHGERDAVEVIS